MHLPVFDGVQEALEMHSIQRKKALEEIKTEEAKKKRVQWKIERTKDAERRKIWSKKHGRDTYGHEDDDVDHCAVKMVVRDIKASVKLVVPEHIYVQTIGTVLTIKTRAKKMGCPSHQSVLKMLYLVHQKRMTSQLVRVELMVELIERIAP